jgi:hypothetical protein
MSVVKEKTGLKTFHATLTVTRLEEWCVTLKPPTKPGRSWPQVRDIVATSVTASTWSCRNSRMGHKPPHLDVAGTDASHSMLSSPVRTTDRTAVEVRAALRTPTSAPSRVSCILHNRRPLFDNDHLEWAKRFRARRCGEGCAWVHLLTLFGFDRWLK